MRTSGIPGGDTTDTASSGGSDNEQTQRTATIAGARPNLLTQQTTKKRWAGWWERFWPTWLMIFGFFALMYYGKQLGILGLVVFVQAKVYRELVTIALRQEKEEKLPGFSFFYHYWFAVAVYAVYGRVLFQYAQHHPALLSMPVVGMLLTKHVSLAFLLWVLGVCAFVLSLRNKKFFRYQFSQFAYCHMALFMVVWQSTFVAANAFKGLLWMVLPATLVVCNDVWAYVFGFFFGRTRLIRLSPKKTWEGFIGAYFATLVWGFFFCRLLETTTWGGLNQLMLCPKGDLSLHHPAPCDVDEVHSGVHKYFPVGTYAFARFLPSALHDFTMSEMQLHSLFLASVASLVAPFGGFFASGFKRAFRIKDFGDSIPGHGGFTDRMDCQIVMGAVSYMYFWHFLGLGPATVYGADILVRQLLALPRAEMVAVLTTVAQAAGLQVVPLEPIADGDVGGNQEMVG